MLAVAGLGVVVDGCGAVVAVVVLDGVGLGVSVGCWMVGPRPWEGRESRIATEMTIATIAMPIAPSAPIACDVRYQGSGRG